MSDLLLRITNLTLEFDIYGKENRFHRNIGQKLHLIRSHHIQSFKALDNVSMTVRRGERVAIMGHNGAGKSSLLKVIAGVYHVEKGKVELNGSIAPLIELGAGFNPTLSARKNIILNGAMFGYPRREMIAKTPEILQFSGLNEFADVPIKNYSSGMRRRLAFTIATDMHPDLLIIDEIFAGGDLQFVGRARARMQDLMGRANALLMVSHNLNLLEQFCERGIWLHKGKIRMEGPVSQVTAAYRASVPAPAVIPGESPAAGTRNGNTNTNSEVIKVKDRDDVAEAQPEILFDPRDPMHVQPTQGLWERVTTCHCGGRVVPCAIAPWSICKRCRSWVNVHRLKKEALPRLLSLDPRPVGVYSPGISRYLSSNKEVDFEPLVSTLDFENKAIPRVKPGARIAHIGCGSGELLKLLENKSGELAGFEEDTALAEQARGNTKAKIINGGSESFGTGEFDVIYCIDHLGRAHDVPDELARLKKALAPEGRLILVEPVFDDPAAPMHYPAALLSKLLYNYIFSIGAVHTQAHVAGFIETEEAGTWNNWPILILK